MQRSQQLAKLQQIKCQRCPKLHEQFAEMERRYDLFEKQRQYKHLVSDDNLLLLPEFNQRLMVLRKLSYLDEASVLRKGRVACEVPSASGVCTRVVR